MIGREEFISMPDGLNMLRVRQSSDISGPASKYCGKSALRGWKEEGGLLAVSTGGRSYRHRMIAGENGNVSGEDEKSEGGRPEARQKEYLKAGNEAIG